MSARTSVLVVEDDRDICEVIHLLLEHEGYTPQSVSSLEEALALIDVCSFRCIVTDLFRVKGQDPLDSIAELQSRAYPTPIIVMTAWLVQQEEAERRNLSSILIKPFNISDLVATVAACLATPLSPEQQRQAQVVHAYFAALTARDWDALVALCTEDVTYVLPGALPYSGTVQGKAAFRAYTEQTYRDFQDATFDQVRAYARPRGLAARFHGRWQGADGSVQEQTGSVVFQFAGERIAHIGVTLNTERLQDLVQALGSRESQQPCESA